MFGTQVTKSWTLPASATTNTLFTVSGGLVAITGLVGQVTTLDRGDDHDPGPRPGHAGRGRHAGH